MEWGRFFFASKLLEMFYDLLYNVNLISLCRYNTKHFNDEATPKATKTMLSTT